MTQSALEGPVNIGGEEYVTVDQLVAAVIAVSGKRIHVKRVAGPVGVQARNFSKPWTHSLGWEASLAFQQGIARTYRWIEGQVKAAR